MIRRAGLDDWEALKELWAEFKASKHAMRIEGDVDQLGRYFSVQLVSPDYCCLILERAGMLLGFGLMNEVDFGLGTRVCFIRALYSSPGVTKEEGAALQAGIMEWSRQRGLRDVIGFCNIGFPLKAYERLHGIKARYTVVGKEVR